MFGHISGDQSSAAADDFEFAFSGVGQMSRAQSGVNGHIIDALFGLFLNNLEDHFPGEVDIIVIAVGSACDLIDGHGTDWYGRVGDDIGADNGEIAPGTQIHYGIGAVADGGLEFFNFGLGAAGKAGSTDIGVDFCGQIASYADRFQGIVSDIGRYYGASCCNFVHNEFRCPVFGLCHFNHGRGNDALLCGGELSIVVLHKKLPGNAVTHRERNEKSCSNSLLDIARTGSKGIISAA